MPSDATNTFLKHLGMQLVAGGSAGCVEVSIMHPLDLVKTRFQIQSTHGTPGSGDVYSGLGDCFKKMYRSEGLLSFWKGVVPPILVETPKRAWKFCTFEQFKRILVFSENQPSALTYSLAGLGSGISEAIIVNPFEVVKVKMQSNRDHRSVAPSTLTVARSIIKEDGLLGGQGLLSKGVTATMGRNGAFNMIYFGFYHTVKEYFPPLQVRNESKC
uniref:Mitochondrial 2-oxodicarboxylate carrier n=1 Tax=Caligus rogercresseyi TaxID=217165 RepID=C1BPF2_CALRO|nr:Mitochondrial 2-oxodicarboxylate carrier [Caligus rogercresseyi]